MISTARELVTPPTGEPLSLAEAKEHLRIIDDSTQDTLIAALITTAREYCEQLCGPLITQTWRVYFGEWPEDGFALPGKAQSVASLKYTSAGVQVTVDASTYRVDTVSMPGRVALDYGRSWPSAALSPLNPIEITAVLGYGDTGAAVPAPIRHALLLLVSHWFEHPEGVIVATKGTVDSRPLAMGVESLLANYRIV